MAISPCGCDAPFIGPSIASCSPNTALFMAFLNTLFTNACDISEICERIVPVSEPQDEYDFIVIGSGSGGATAAGRLSEISEFKVLLLEAGHDEPPGTQVPSQINTYLGPTQLNWNFTTQPQPDACISTNGCSWPMGKVLGGTTVLNGMKYLRATRADFDRWVNMGAEGWSYDEVLPFYLKSENNAEFGDSPEHAVGGPVTISRFPHQPDLALDLLNAGEELGYPVTDDLSNSESITGFTIGQMMQINGSRLSTARAFLRPNRNRPNFDIMINSTATRIIVNTTDSEKRATAVEFVYNDQVYQVKVRKEVIVSAGPVQSPKLLLLSGIGPKDALDAVNITQVHDLPGVGQNLHNHVAYALTFNLTAKPGINDLNWNAIAEYLTTRTGVLSSNGISQAAARLNSQFADPSGNDPDVQLSFVGYVKANCAEACDEGPIPDTYRTLTINPTNILPRSRGYLTLASNDPFEPPLIYPNYLLEQEDLLVLRDAVRIAQRLGNTTVLRKTYGAVFVPSEYGDCDVDFLFDSDEFWECVLRNFTKPENHQAGSCKIGSPNDPLSVVNPQLQLYGIPNIRVIDASVQPQVVAANPVATIIMIAEKGVEHIKQLYISDKNPLYL